ncbi:hypothetical protein BDW02DRAFT_324827 [Decorospora gaudefroyi]|uniref:Uncharacterized protein n=1 Tax=Decorospora gaudefroyi TaxID=184978 RepID=A0A6A5KGA6_9PLEO|nr:hypothetical protein BDW02DRAFT_324827 [Decorospora gaudefroyi]
MDDSLPIMKPGTSMLVTLACILSCVQRQIEAHTSMRRASGILIFKLWCGLEPAMRLASRLLTSTPVMAFLRKIKFGHEITDPSTQRRYLVEDANIPMDEANAEVMHDLMKLSEKLNHIFTAIGPDPDGADSQCGQCHAIHYVSQSEFGERIFLPPGEANRLPTDTGKYHYIVLNQAYREYFTTSTERTPCRDMRTRFLLASTIIHETVGHAFYARNRIDGNEDYAEPFFAVDQADIGPELGCAVDFLLYGVYLNAIIDSCSGAHLECWPILSALKDGEVVTVESHVISPVSTCWIKDLFSETIWSNIEKAPSEFQLKAFRIPQSSWGAVRDSLDTDLWRWMPRLKVLKDDGTLPIGQQRWAHLKVSIEVFEKKNKKALEEELADTTA